MFSNIFILGFPNSCHAQVERAQIVVLHKNGLPQRQINKELRIGKSSVQRAIAKF